MVPMSQELFDKADRLEADGQIESALDSWRELAFINPTQNAFLRLANCANSLGLLDEAEESFKKVLEIDPHSPRALASLGFLAINRLDHEGAESYFKRACAVEEDPGSFTAWGVALRRLGKDLEAEAAYRAAIRIDSKYERHTIILGFCSAMIAPRKLISSSGKRWS